MAELDVEKQTHGLPSSDQAAPGWIEAQWCTLTSTIWRIPEQDTPGYTRSSLKLLHDPWLLAIFLIVPLAWASHWKIEQWGHDTTFVLCFLAMIPLQKMFDWGGEQMGNYFHADFRDLLVITMSNAVEATLSIILLRKCELRLLQSTIVGVVLLHLLLIPGIPFFVDGSQIFEQILHPHYASQNLSLLMIGVLGIVIPTVYFAALDRGPAAAAGTQQQSGLPPQFVPLVSDYVRDDILKMSRGISIILLVVYVVSRWYRHSPPDRQNAVGEGPETERAQQHRERAAPVTEKEAHPVVCFLLLLTVTGLMAPTAEFLVSSIEDVRQTSGIQTEWFGLVLLPMMSCSADGVVGVAKFYQRVRKTCKSSHNTGDGNNKDATTVAERHGVEDSNGADDYEGGARPFASEFAHGRPIDLSIQFTLWWTPFLVLLGWWSDRPMHLLFDYFEVALLLGSCFLVNYVLVDFRTNMSEGLTMISFYAMIATATWFYPGQPQVEFMLSCPGSVVEAVAGGVEH